MCQVLFLELCILSYFNTLILNNEVCIGVLTQSHNEISDGQYDKAKIFVVVLFIEAEQFTYWQ